MKEADAHKFFSASCFNEVWTFLDKANRTCEEDRLMREMAHASLFHWLKREDATPENLSVGLWQVSRVYSVLERPMEAKAYAGECVEFSEKNELPPFFLGYACEAAARAARVAGEEEAKKAYLGKARACLEEVSEADDRKLLETDLDELSD
jgi:hypothetical protein